MIYITHGTVPSWSSERISHALFLPELQIDRHLKQRRKKYVSLSQAFQGRGDALTIDDATHGALQLALAARRHGHAVSWFVNGSNIEDRVQYYPFQVSSMLDNTRARTCRFGGMTWNLPDLAARRALRLRIKETYMRMRSQDEIEALIDRLASSLHVDPAAMEKSLSTVGPGELAVAAMAGVELQNHSWSHINPQVISEAARTGEVIRNENYLSQFRKAVTRVFAPPFGQSVSLASAPADFVLLANRGLHSSHRQGNLANRGELLLNAATRTSTPRVRASGKNRIAA
jgi:peptidoglycan/xylan/chitin deacetylase (PgdA/CDA1 family)